MTTTCAHCRHDLQIRARGLCSVCYSQLRRADRLDEYSTVRKYFQRAPCRECVAAVRLTVASALAGGTHSGTCPHIDRWAA